MRGSCLYGQVVYSVEKLNSAPRHCSCNTCRKAHASAINTSASVKRAEFQWLEGESLLSSFESSAGKRRYFCSVCGSQLIAYRAGSETSRFRLPRLMRIPGKHQRRTCGSLAKCHGSPAAMRSRLSTSGKRAGGLTALNPSPCPSLRMSPRNVGMPRRNVPSDRPSRYAPRKGLRRQRRSRRIPGRRDHGGATAES